MTHPDEDALSSDLYLDQLLAACGRSGTSGSDPSAVGSPGGGHRPPEDLAESPAVDPTVRAAAELLAQSLVRFHPSFRFEEWVAGRLREAAEAMATPGAPDVEPIVVPLRARVPADATVGGADTTPAGTPDEAPRRRPGLPGAELVWSAEGVNRGLLLGGAIASGVSIAGAAAFVAWRRRTRLEERPA